ncbi:uncharacterized protein HKW66_Vig0221460 [Vigna angularis]|uniref:Knottin scorpion toxin-like domain-containing protein n=1 Tax=Phaseolus angularis TaxID=3914 RepID=A0A8T0K093_PHAAN|nr:uncharacterized protein HKW66_Vig0221460 [Vigna angularis]
MGKFEMKSIGIMITIMILLNFAQPVLSTSYLCRLKCTLKCVPLRFGSKNFFDTCVNDCKSRCSQLSNHHFYNCISDCHLMKFNAINNGAPKVYNGMNTCVQKCKKLL